MHDLATNAHWDGPLSPNTVQAVVCSHENLTPAQLWALINELFTTLQQRDRAYQDGQHHIKEALNITNKERLELKAQLNAIAGEPLKCPTGFKPNDRWFLHFTIPGATGEEVACYVKQLDDGQLAGITALAMGKHDVHVTKIYAQPDLDEWPLEPLPSWFHTNLWGDPTTFHPLHEAIIATDDWGLLAEALWYQTLDREAIQLQTELRMAEADLVAVNNAKDACEDCLVVARAVEKVWLVGVKWLWPQLGWWGGWRTVGHGHPI
jgi:hypothetical protein